ncbi:PPBT protein, partial [Alectura lathami]|nr:PPBT protein [Alectura lathami]
MKAFLLTLLAQFCSASLVPEKEKDPEYWRQQAQETLREALRLQRLNQNVAKNLILFLGDGMGVSTVTAARILKGQLENRKGEESVLEMEKFPYVALAKTYNTNAQVPDSAGTATAYLCGVKANEGTVGVSAGVTRDRCNTTKGQEVTSILRWAKDEGKAVGIVTTTRVTHATPSAAYAHSANRDWYSDGEMPPDALEGGCKDIARQLVENIPDIEVILGGGRKYMFPKNASDVEYPQEERHRGTRLDRRDLVQEWHSVKPPGKVSKYVWHRRELLALNVSRIDFLLGESVGSAVTPPGCGAPPVMGFLPRQGHSFCPLGDVISAPLGTPFFRAPHPPQCSFPAPWGCRIWPGGRKEGLGASLASYLISPGMGSGTGRSASGSTNSGAAPGTGAESASPPQHRCPQVSSSRGTCGSVQAVSSFHLYKLFLLFCDIPPPAHANYQAQSAVPLRQETHGGEDVAVFARGPMAHLLHGVHEQNYIPHAMAYAACIGPNRAHCSSAARPAA